MTSDPLRPRSHPLLAVVTVLVAIVLFGVTQIEQASFTNKLHGVDQSQIASNTARIRDEAAQQRSATRTLCQAGNDFRRQDKKLWLFVLRLAPPPSGTAERDRVAQFNTFINQHDKLRRCR